MSESDQSVLVKSAKKKHYTIQEKIEFAESVKNYESLRTAAREMQVPKSPLASWVQQLPDLKGMEDQSRHRLPGGGKRPSNEHIERDVLDWIRGLRAKKRIVNLKMIRDKFRQLAQLSGSSLVASPTYIRRFMDKHSLSYRVATHKAQDNQHLSSNKCAKALEFLVKYQALHDKFEPDLIVNMDETPLWYDHAHNKTVDQLGAKSVDVVTTGHDKTRFTGVVSVAASGKKLKTMMIFRGLKKPPKTEDLREDVVLLGTHSGSMNTDLMVHYIDQVLVPHYNGRPGLLLMDSYSSHYAEPVLRRLRELDIELLLIPGGTTDILQPLDVSINRPLKEYYKDAWLKWFNDDANVKLTKSGNRQRPSYTALVSMTMDAMDKIPDEMVRGAFACCGRLDTRLSTWSYFSALNNKLRAACFFENSPECLADLTAIFAEPNGDQITASINSFATRGFKKYLDNNTRVSSAPGDASILSVTTEGEADDSMEM